jgi:hypothetical protein
MQIAAGSRLCAWDGLHGGRPATLARRLWAQNRRTRDDQDVNSEPRWIALGFPLIMAASMALHTVQSRVFQRAYQLLGGADGVAEKLHVSAGMVRAWASEKSRPTGFVLLRCGGFASGCRRSGPERLAARASACTLG